MSIVTSSLDFISFHQGHSVSQQTDRHADVSHNLDHSMNGLTDGWVDRQTDGLTCRRTSVFHTARRKHRQTGRLTCRLTGGWVAGRTDGWTYLPTDQRFT